MNIVLYLPYIKCGSISFLLFFYFLLLAFWFIVCFFLFFIVCFFPIVFLLLFLICQKKYSHSSDKASFQP